MCFPIAIQEASSLSNFYYHPTVNLKHVTSMPCELRGEDGKDIFSEKLSFNDSSNC